MRTSAAWSEHGHTIEALVRPYMDRASYRSLVYSTPVTAEAYRDALQTVRIRANAGLVKWWALECQRGGRSTTWAALHEVTIVLSKESRAFLSVALLEAIVPPHVRRLRIENFQYADSVWVNFLRRRPGLTALAVSFPKGWCGYHGVHHLAMLPLLAHVLATDLPSLTELELARFPSGGVPVVCMALRLAPILTKLRLHKLIVRGFSESDANALALVLDAPACRRLRSLTLVQENDCTLLWPLVTDMDADADANADGPSPKPASVLGQALAEYLEDEARCGALETLRLHLHTVALKQRLLTAIATSPCTTLRRLTLGHSSVLDHPFLKDVFPASKARLEALDLTSYRPGPRVFEGTAHALHTVRLHTCILDLATIGAWFRPAALGLHTLAVHNGTVEDLPGLFRHLARAAPLRHLTVRGHNLASDVIRELCATDGWAHLTELTLHTRNRYLDAAALMAYVKDGTLRRLQTLDLTTGAMVNQIAAVRAIQRLQTVCPALRVHVPLATLGKRRSAVNCST